LPTAQLANDGRFIFFASIIARLRRALRLSSFITIRSSAAGLFPSGARIAPQLAGPRIRSIKGAM
jgi:hypothetical protein